jgi:hypothetical protein
MSVQLESLEAKVHRPVGISTGLWPLVRLLGSLSGLQPRKPLESAESLPPYLLRDIGLPPGSHR